MTARELFIVEDLLNVYETGISRMITGLQRVTLLVGPNNSGKSLLLRSMFLPLRRGDYVPASAQVDDLIQRRDALIELAKDSDAPKANKLLVNLRSTVIPAVYSENLVTSMRQYTDHYNALFRDSNVEIYKQAHYYFRDLHSYCLNSANFEGDRKKQVIYIPTVRGFRSKNKGDFEEIARQDYWNGNGPPDKCPEIFAGDSMTETLRGLLLGNRREREAVREFEEFIGSYFFDGQPITLVPKPNDRRVEIKVGKEADQAVAHLGDGIQHLILMLLKPLTSAEPTALLIEEPELFLHPGMQTRLLDAFLSDRLNHVQVIATTHSNHLINLSVDRRRVGILRFKKSISIEDGADEGVARFHVSPLSLEDRSILSDLGVQKASVLLTNCVLFVEGPTDRLYYQRFLDIYTHQNGLPRFLPDLHYSFLEYGGSNITSYDFANDAPNSINHQRLAGDRVLIITDTDTQDWKQKRRELMSAAGMLVASADAREVENLLPSDVIRSVIAKYEKDDETKVPKLEYVDYQHEALGNYIESQFRLAGVVPNRRAKSGRPYSVESGSLKEKADFCMRALEFLRLQTAIPQAAHDIAEKIYLFIEESNPGVGRKISQDKRG